MTRFGWFVACGALSVSRGAAQAPGGQPYPNLSEARYETVTDYEVMVPMRDGMRLAANIVRPKVAGRLPILINYLPYGKNPRPFFAERGYVTIFAEQRGTGRSEGVMTDYFVDQAAQDGYDLVEWAARQPWSNGKVGLWGTSFGAINATRIAAKGPPHLAAIAVNSSYANFFGDHWYPGGVRTNHPYVWHGATNVLYTMLRGPVYDDGKGGKVVDLATWKRHVEDNGWRGFFRPQWDHPQYDGYWQEKDLRSKYAQFAVPTLQFANYFDHSRNHDEAYQNYLILKARKIPQKLVLGPWPHGGLGTRYLIDEDVMSLAWFDHFLKGLETGIAREPPVTLFVMRQNRWRFEEDWPVARTIPTRLYLGAPGTLSGSAQHPASAGARFAYRPWVGSAAGPYGTWFGFKYDEYLVQPDQRTDEAESLTFTGDELAEDTEVTGMPEINFYASSSADNTDFTIKLSDVSPDGRSELVTRGWLNSSYRESNVNPRLPAEWRFVPPSPIAPGTVYQYRVTLQNVSYLFQKGHRLRVTIASSDWPSNWPNAKPADNEIRFASPDGSDASFVTLPIVPRPQVPLAPPMLPARATPTPLRGDDDSAESYRIENDLSNRTMTYRYEGKGDRPAPGGTFHDSEEWTIVLRKEPPYDQVTTLVYRWTLVRKGQPDVSFTYRVRTDGSGPTVDVVVAEAKTP